MTGTEILGAVGRVAGIGGLALGVFLLLYRDVISKKVFPTLTKQQAFRIFVLLLVLVWLIALAGIGAWIWVETPRHSVAGGSQATRAELFIDDVVQVLDHSIPATGRVLVFDITLRNPSPHPINVTDVTFRFDRELGGGAMAVEKVSGTYVITVAEKGASSLGPNGRFEATTWYPSGQSMIVMAALSQSLAPQTTDRFRVAVEFEPGLKPRGPLETLAVSVRYNDAEQAFSKTIGVQK